MVAKEHSIISLNLKQERKPIGSVLTITIKDKLLVCWYNTHFNVTVQQVPVKLTITMHHFQCLSLCIIRRPLKIGCVVFSLTVSKHFVRFVTVPIQRNVKLPVKQDTVEVGSLHTLRLESLKLVYQPLHKFIVNKLFICYFIFISPLFNHVGKLRTSSHLQLRPGQDKAKQFDTYNNTELLME